MFRLKKQMEQQCKLFVLFTRQEMKASAERAKQDLLVTARRAAAEELKRLEGGANA